MIDSIIEVTGADFNTVETDEEAAELVRSLGINLEGTITRGEAIALVFDERVEEVALMLSGDRMSMYALEHAKALLNEKK